MGKRRKQAKVIVKRQKTTKFTCPRCHQIDSVTIHIKKDQNRECFCHNCGASFVVPDLTTFQNEFNVISEWNEYERDIRQQKIYCPFCKTPSRFKQISSSAALLQCYSPQCQCIYKLDLINESFQEALEKWRLLKDDEQQRMLHKVVSLGNKQNQQKRKQLSSKKKTSKRKQQESSSEYSQEEDYNQNSIDRTYSDEDARQDKQEFNQQVNQETMIKRMNEEKHDDYDDEAFSDVQNDQQQDDQQPELEDDI